MLPPLIYRVLNSEADSEQAYILACQLVLPAGMVGLMVAAMASATASMATTRLNVFAGAFTSEVYHRIINQAASEKRLVFVGRAATIILGCVVLSGALLIPKYGYTSFLISINALLNGPLMLPTIWGLFSRKIGLGAVWATILAGFLTAFIVKFGLSNEGFLNGVEALRPLVDLIAANNRIVDLIAGIVLPLIILVTLELRSDGEHPGWQRVLAKKQVFRQATTLKSSTLPGKMVVVSLAVIAVVMFVLSFINREESGLLIAFAIVLGCISGAIYIPIRRTEKFGPN
jgi:Na+/proline symporter